MENFTTKLNSKLILLFCAVILACSAAAVNAQPGAFTEGFGTVPPAGWTLDNNSQPQGPLTYRQGVPDGTPQSNGGTCCFDAQSGPVDSYAAVNFNSTTGAGTISNWMISPVIDLSNGSQVSFYTRTIAGSPYPDRLQLRLSTNGASVNVGTTATDVGDFTVLLTDVNPTLVEGGYPEAWTQFTATISGLNTPTTGRVAFRYFVTNGGPSGDNSNFIGIDTFVFTPATATASGVTVSGKVLATENKISRTVVGVSRAVVTLTNMSGQVISTKTDSAGNYRFEEVNAGETYIVNVISKRYNFAPQAITITENLSDLNFMTY